MKMDGPTREPSFFSFLRNMKLETPRHEHALRRLCGQQIAHSQVNSPAETVAWMGAMQAQDYNMAKWAIGVRLPGADEKSIEAAFDRGEFLRTHALRPTWHFVTAQDIRWILALSAPQIRSALQARHRELGLDETIMRKCRTVIENTLSQGRHCTRDELALELAKIEVRADNNRLAHVLMLAEIDGQICSGVTRGKQQTYALLDERAPACAPTTREEALGKLAQTYFTSHGPASLQDFTWWSGLPVGDARKGLEMIKSTFVADKHGEQIYWQPASDAGPDAARQSAFLLPAFDEFLISYRDRSASITFEEHKKAVSDNGIFRPMIVVDGRVTGIWKRTVRKNHSLVEAQYFQEPDLAAKSALEKAAARYANFLGHQVLVQPE